MSYLVPTSTTPPPGGLTLTQFIQTVFVGISNIAGTLVRPDFQVEPPKQPDLTVDWLAIGIRRLIPDANLFIGVKNDGTTGTQRHEELEIQASIYGPNAIDTFGLLRDGFQIPQNLAALKTANMGFKEITEARRVPDLTNERYINRLVTSVFLRREVIRIYPILTIVSATGTIHTVLGNEEYLLDWAVEAP